MGGTVQTTAPTTAAGLMMTATRRAARITRTGRERSGARMALLVRQVFELGRELAHPPPVVQAADEPAVPLVPGHIQELLLCDQRPEPGQVRICAVAHDPADDAGELAPLAFGERLAVARDRDEERRRGAGDRIREELFGLRPGDDLAAGADDVGDPVAANADDVATTSDGGALEVTWAG